MKILLKHGNLINEKGDISNDTDLLINGKVIEKIGKISPTRQMRS